MNSDRTASPGRHSPRRTFSPQTLNPQSERGSALLLVPATVVIIVILTAFALNSALTFLARQELERRAGAMANDVVSAMAPQAFYGAGHYDLNTERSIEMLIQTSRTRTQDSVTDVRFDWWLVNDRTLVVRASGRPRIAAWRILPWTAGRIVVDVSAEAFVR